jgi:signal transduction histidine kinase
LPAYLEDDAMPAPGAGEPKDDGANLATQSVSPSVWLPLRQILEMLDDGAEREFDNIITLAADLFRCQRAGILLHDGGRYWFKTRTDRTEGDAASTDGSFLRHTMACDSAFLVTDARDDPRFADHPRVAGPPHIRFFIGAPLIAHNGRRLGALVVMDGAPHDAPDPLRQRLLRQLASDIMREIEARGARYANSLGRATGRAIATGNGETVFAVAPDWTVQMFEQGRHPVIAPDMNPIGSSLWSVLGAAEGTRLRAELARAMTERQTVDFDEFLASIEQLVSFRIFSHEMGGLVLTCRAADRASEAEFALRASEARLHRSEVHFSRAQKMAQVGSAEMAFATGEQYWSEEMYRIFGLPPGSRPPTLDQLVEELVYPDDRPILRENHARQMRGDYAPRCEYRIIRPDGLIRTILRLGEMTLGADGRPARYMSTVQDVTELRAAEHERDEYHRQLQHAQRLEALGTLAGGIAHDLNNTLVPVLALSQMMLKDHQLDSEHRRSLEVLRHAGERARDLVRQVLTFSRDEPVRRQQIDLHATIADSLRMVRASINPRIEIGDRLAPAMTALADPGQIHRVIVNLVTNAAQAIGERNGTITVSLAPSPEAPGHARLTVTDDGPGMDAQTMSRIFEPFFTTKGYGVGSGLGLSIVHGIVTSHGGRVWAASAPNTGTRMSVELPLLQAIPALEPESVAA